MKNRPSQSKSSKFPPFRVGQVWELTGSEIHIGMVGKTLVHYKHFHGTVKRAPVSLANQRALEDFLVSKKAVLIKK